MKQETYAEGKFAQIQLPDGSRYFVETGPVGLRIRKVGLLGPNQLIWEYTFPFYIRTYWAPSDRSSHLLELVLRHLSRCITEHDLKRIIVTIEQDLQIYVQDNFDNVYSETIARGGAQIAEDALQNWQKKGYKFQPRIPGRIEKHAVRLQQEIDRLTEQQEISTNQRMALKSCIESAQSLAMACRFLKKSAGITEEPPNKRSAEGFLHLCFSEILIFSKTVLADQRTTTFLGVSEIDLVDGLMKCAQIDDKDAVDEIFTLYSNQPRELWREQQLKQFASHAGDSLLMELFYNDPAALLSILLTGPIQRQQIYGALSALVPEGLDFSE